MVARVVGNRVPVANMTWKSVSGLVAIFHASVVNVDNESVDPDGDRLQYRFNFGDGNMTGWMDNPEIWHRYHRPGIYTVSVKFRDIRGADSERTFHDIVVVDVPNGPPFFIITGTTTIEVDDWVPQTPLSFRPCIIDPDGDPITVNVLWGDGCSETYNYTTDDQDHIDHMYEGQGTYIIELTASDDEGNERKLNYTLHLRERKDTPKDIDPPILILMIAVVAILVIMILIVLVLAFVLISRSRSKDGEE
jgi:hypothetical protein